MPQLGHHTLKVVNRLGPLACPQLAVVKSQQEQAVETTFAQLEARGSVESVGSTLTLYKDSCATKDEPIVE